MQRNFTTTPQVSKVKITFTKRKMTAYGGFALLASFFERIGFAGMIEKAMPITECSPNTMGIYGKSISLTDGRGDGTAEGTSFNISIQVNCSGLIFAIPTR